MKKSKILNFLEQFSDATVRDLSFSEIYSENLIVENSLGRIIGRDLYASTFSPWLESFPDWYVKTKKVELYDNLAIVSYEYSGTYIKPYASILDDYPNSAKFLDQISQASIGKEVKNLSSECTYIFDEDSLVRMYSHSEFDVFCQQLGICFVLKRTGETLLSRLKDLFPLSSRECQCVGLILLGFSAKYIASKFFISPRTVETHLRKVYEKLGCSNKKQCFEMMLSNQSLHLWHVYGTEIMNEYFLK